MNTAELPGNVAKLRLVYAATALLAPRVASGAIGWRPSQVTGAGAAWARLFATREAALGAVTLGAGDDPALRKRLLLLNAAVDGVDALAAALVARKTRSLRFFLFAVPGAVASSVGHLVAAQQVAAEA